MDIVELLTILRQGEGPRVEFKETFTDQSHKIAKEMAALANSGGGILLLGVTDDGDLIGIPEANKAEERLAGIARACSPPLWPHIERIHASKSICIIYAQIPAQAPCFYQGKIYVRVGTTSVECCGGEEFKVLLSNMPADKRIGPSYDQSGPAVSTLPRGRKKPTIATIEDVIDWNWNGNHLLDQLIEIDYATIEGLTPENEGHTAQWAPVFMEHPDTWRLLIDGPERIVGYWHFVPLFDAEYRVAKAGELLDGDITSERLCYLEVSGIYNIYFVSISLLPDYRGVGNFRLLLDSLFERFTELAKRNIYFKEICANAFTKAGEALCKTLDMKAIGEHKEKGRLYLQTFSPLPNLRIFREYPEFVTLYSTHSDGDSS